MTDHNTEPAPPPSTPRPALCELPVDDHAKAAGIVNIKHGGIGGTVSILKCQPDTVRARHLHREDSHWCFVLRGMVEYYERAPGSTEKPEPQLFHEGELFFTPPLREHAMYFPIYTELLSLSAKTRTHEEHEADVVRVDFPIP